jgi:hypothetical protein
MDSGLVPTASPTAIPLIGCWQHQAELERLVLLTADPQLTTFPCQTLW